MTDLISPDDHVLVVVAHPDDETFGCGSTVASAVAIGARVTVVCATRGELGEPAPGCDLAGRTLGEVREDELYSAGAILGAHRVQLLDHRDSGFDGPCADDALCGVPFGDLVAELRAIISDVQPTMVVALDGCDGHRDHVRIREALLAANEDIPMLLSTIPNALMRRWLDEQVAAGRMSAYHTIDPAALGTADAASFAVDVEAVLPTRERAIAAHASQRSPFEDLSPALRRAFLATDHLIPAHPALTIVDRTVSGGVPGGDASRG